MKNPNRLDSSKFWMSTTLSALSMTIILVTSCTTTQDHREVPPGPRVAIMAYNVENLFDTTHDEGKDDHTFLPKALKQKPEIRAACEKQDSDYRKKECFETDWNDEVLDRKLSRLVDVIEQVGNGRGPDILILEEVENVAVLNQLADRLKKSDYKTRILIEGFDNRGIDTAVLSRLPEWDKARLHRVPLKAEKPEDKSRASSTRGILEARLQLPDGQKLSVFAVHFPSQANPSYLRKQAIDFLTNLKKNLPKDVLALAGGDFNISSTEDASLGFYGKVLNQDWLVSHQIGCEKCEGTNYYHPKREWSFLDALIFSPSMKLGAEGPSATWVVDPGSIMIPNRSKYQVNKYGSPARFEQQGAEGISDHWPIYAEIYKPQIQAPASK